VPLSQTNIGVFYLLAAIGLISVVDTICKFYTDELHAVMLVWGYFVSMTVFVTAYFGSCRQFALLQSGHPVLQIARSGFLVVSIASLFVSLTYLPIAEATAIGFTGPLFITALSVPFLGERVGWHRWLAVIIGLAGVLVIVRPAVRSALVGRDGIIGRALLCLLPTHHPPPRGPGSAPNHVALHDHRRNGLGQLDRAVLLDHADKWSIGNVPDHRGDGNRSAFLHDPSVLEDGGIVAGAIQLQQTHLGRDPGLLGV
jgi:hypothetical protein